VTGFDIDGDIVCTPFADRFDNGLAGWTAEFIVTTHNDKNRCLFTLSNPIYLGYRVTDCLTNVSYNATFDLQTGQVLGGAYATLINPSLPANYGNLQCWALGQPLEQATWELTDVVVQNWPTADLIDCEECNLWINPKIWNTTPATWNNEFRTWITD